MIEWSVTIMMCEWSAQRTAGPFPSVWDAAMAVPDDYYTATLTPIINGKRQCMEDNEATKKFRDFLKQRLMTCNHQRYMNHIIDRATQ